MYQEDAVGAVSTAGGVSRDTAELYVRAFRHVIDSLATDGVTVVVPPLVVSQPNNPTWRRLRILVKDEQWEVPDGGLDSPVGVMATALRLPESVLTRYPVVGDVGVCSRVHGLLGVDAGNAERTLRMLATWAEQFRARDGGLRRYDVQPAGREREFEDWLEADLTVLAKFGYLVETEVSDDVSRVRARQHVFPDRRRSDLIVRAIDDCARMRKGDWLVIENKTTAVGSPAEEQLSLYVDWLNHHLGGDAVVHGLLIADGFSVNLIRALEERNFGQLSLTQLGYRELLWSTDRPRSADPDFTSIPYPSAVLP